MWKIKWTYALLPCNLYKVWSMFIFINTSSKGLFDYRNRNRGIGIRISILLMQNRQWEYISLFSIWFSHNLMGNSWTPKFMFYKINKNKTGIRIPIPPIEVELPKPIFGPKMEYVFQFWPKFQFWFSATKWRIQNFKNLHAPIPLVFPLPNKP